MSDSELIQSAGPVFDSWPPADVARCTNESCDVRESCIRWTHRKQKHARVFTCGLGGKNCRLFVNDGTFTQNTKNNGRQPSSN